MGELMAAISAYVITYQWGDVITYQWRGEMSGYRKPYCI